MRTARPVKLILALVATALMVASPAHAQVTTRVRVNLRADSSTGQRPLRVLAARETLILRAPDTSVTSFLAVRTQRGEEGWVSAEYVWLDDPDVQADAVAPLDIRHLDDPVTTISADWEKPPVTSSRINYRGTASAPHKTCGPPGAGPVGSTKRIDSATFRLKNRTDVPLFSYAVTWEALAKLPYARANVPKDRFLWPDSIRTEIERFEGVPLTVTGFIAGITDQKKGTGNATGELTNCRWTEPLHVDWHVSMTPRHTDSVNKAFVVEPTPRLIRRHAATWTIARLNPLTGGQRQAGDSVRVTGFLFFDPDHFLHTKPDSKGCMFGEGCSL